MLVEIWIYAKPADKLVGQSGPYDKNIADPGPVKIEGAAKP